MIFLRDVPFLQGLFSVVPLNWTEWKAVLYISLPIIPLDEGLKFLERKFFIQTSNVDDVVQNGRPKKE